MGEETDKTKKKNSYTRCLVNVQKTLSQHNMDSYASLFNCMLTVVGKKLGLGVCQQMNGQESAMDTHNGVSCSHKEKWNHDIFRKIDETGNHSIQGNRLGSERETNTTCISLACIIYIKTCICVLICVYLKVCVHTRKLKRGPRGEGS